MLEDKKSLQISGRTNPLSDSFRREMETIFSRVFGNASPFFPMDTAAQRTGFPSLDMSSAVSPAIDVNETETAIELSAELPGLSEEDVEIELKGRHLTLRGQKNVTHDSKGDLHLNERIYGSFTRTMTLPDSVDIETITATFDRGVLKVTMPKTEPKDPSRRIKVSST